MMVVVLLLLAACSELGSTPWAREDTALRGFPDPSLAMPPRCLEGSCWALPIRSSTLVTSGLLALDDSGGAWALGRSSASVEVGGLTLDPGTFAVHWHPHEGTVNGFSFGKDTGPLALVSAPDGDVFALVGVGQGSTMGLEPGEWLVRATSAGELVWSMPVEGTGGVKLRGDGSGGLWAWSTARGGLSVGEHSLPEAAGVRLMRFDGHGKLTEERVLGTFTEVGDVIVDGSATAYVSGLLDGSFAFGAVDAGGEELWSESVVAYDDLGGAASFRLGGLALRDDGVVLGVGKAYGVSSVTLEAPDGTVVHGPNVSFVYGFSADGTYVLGGLASLEGDVTVGPRGAIYVPGAEFPWVALDPTGGFLGTFGFEGGTWNHGFAAHGDTLFLVGQQQAEARWGAVNLEAAGTRQGFLLAVEIPE